jgi:hypothetical protein
VLRVAAFVQGLSVLFGCLLARICSFRAAFAALSSVEHNVTDAGKCLQQAFPYPLLLYMSTPQRTTLDIADTYIHWEWTRHTILVAAHQLRGQVVSSGPGAVAPCTTQHSHQSDFHACAPTPGHDLCHGAAAKATQTPAHLHADHNVRRTPVHTTPPTAQPGLQRAAMRLSVDRESPFSTAEVEAMCATTSAHASWPADREARCH